MNQRDHPFQAETLLRTFFTANECSVTKQGSQLIVQLTEKLDKALMNRPFYWHYMEKTNQKGIPKQITFQLDSTQKELTNETIHIGSPWYQRMYNFLAINATMLYAFEKLDVNKKTLLQPWLLLNCLVTYQGVQQKETLHSFGLNLINGTLCLQMMDAIKKIELAPTISNYCYTISPIITLKSGYKRIETFILEQLENERHEWAVTSGELLQEEIAMIHHFYDAEEDVEQRERELTSAYERLQPKISLKIINGGFIYLRETFIE